MGRYTARNPPNRNNHNATVKTNAVAPDRTPENIPPMTLPPTPRTAGNPNANADPEPTPIAQPANDIKSCPISRMRNSGGGPSTACNLPVPM